MVSEKFSKSPVKSEIIVRDLLSNHLIGIFDSDDQGNYNMKLKSGRSYNVIIRAQGYLDSINKLELSVAKEAISLHRDFDIRKR